MASRRAQGRLARLWQMPLLLVSLGLFGYAAWLFIDPKGGVTIAQRIEVTESLLKKGKFDTALEYGNKLLTAGKLKPREEARVHLLLAQSLEGAQKQRQISLIANHQRIIEQTRLALAGGEKETSDLYRRMAESQEALEHPAEALEAYRKAVALDPDHAPAMQRRIIDLQLAQRDTAPAEASIEAYLKSPQLTPVDRAWALNQKAKALCGHELYADAKPLAEEALKLDPAPVAQGTGHYWLGQCTWKLGPAAEAERILRVARDRLTIAQALDADAAYLLGRIRHEQNDPKEAISFYEQILRSHPAARVVPMARMRRGLSRISLNEDEAGLSDLHAIVNELVTKKKLESFKAEAIDCLKEASAAMLAKGNLTGALEAMEEEQILVPEPPAEYFGRLARVFERRAEQVEQTIADAATPAEKTTRVELVRKLRGHAGDAYIALSRGLTLSDDRAQGEAMWKGVELYDRAGAMPQSISAMETFVAERPDDSSTPDALLKLGRAYQATAQFDKAIKAFQKNQFRYPQSLAASKSGVPLAQAYIATGPAAYSKAEKTLLAVLESPIITPEAEEFRLALFELGQLYYRTGRYEDAIGRLEETTRRYPKDPQMAHLLFLMGDSYRKSAGLLSEKLDSTTKPATQPVNPIDAAAIAAAKAEALAARRDRLNKAKVLFGRIVEVSRNNPPAREIDKLYLKLSHFYRADCFYDLGEYEEAIRLYDAATLRYQDDPSAVSAYIQIVNAYCRLRRFDDAHTANERAKWLLRKMPADAFDEGKLTMPKKYWDDWLRLTGESGMYAKDLQRTPVSKAE